MNEYKDMMLEIEKQGRMGAVMDRIEDAIRLSCAKLKKLGRHKKIFITGCGDSYFGGLAVRGLMQKISESTCFPLTALEFSKYGIDMVDETSTVIGISMSGNVARTIDGVTKAQGKGAYVMGITNSKTGKLFQLAEHPVFLGLEEEPGWTPGTLTYMGTMYALYRISIELSAGDEQVKQSHGNRLKNTMNQIAEVIESSRETAMLAGNNLVYSKPVFPLYCLGGGPSYATAKYGAAKFLEVCDITAIGQESEEFAHQEFWVINKNCPVFIIAPKGAVFSRTKEVAECLRRYGNDLFVISNDEELCGLGKYAFKMPDDVDDLFSPLVYAIPMQLTAYYFSKKQGLDPDRRSHNDPFRKMVSRMLTRGSASID